MVLSDFKTLIVYDLLLKVENPELKLVKSD